MNSFHLALALILSFNFAFAGWPANEKQNQTDFAFFSEYPPQSLIESYPDFENDGLILEIEKIATPEEINEVTNSKAGSQLWQALKNKTASAKEILKSYPNILKYIRSKAPPMIRNVLTKVKVREKYQNLLVGNAENILDSAPEIILQANAHGFGFRLTLFGVVGIGEMIAEKINEYKFFQKLNELSQKLPFKIPVFKFFGLGMGAGVIFLKFEANNKRYAVLRLYANGEYPKKIINFALDGFLGLPFQVKVSEKIDAEKALEQKFWTHYSKLTRSQLSLAGAVTADKEFGRYQHEMYIINSPSPLNSISFYEMQIHQLQLNWVFNIDWVFKISDKIKSRKRSCKKSVSSS